MPLNDCKIINLPKIADPRGNLTFLESFNQVPFDIGRIYYLYDVPGGASRGGHAHKELEQVIIAAAGSFEVILDDGIDKKSFSLNRAYEGLYMRGQIWRELLNFSSGSVCLVIASLPYSESDYIREYSDFLKYVGQEKTLLK